MRLELKDIKDGGLQQQVTFVAADFPLLDELLEQDGVGFSAPIQFQLRLQRSGQLVEVDGQLSTRVQMTCGRCLKRYDEGLTGDFAFTFTPFVAEQKSEGEGEIEVELDTDELGLVFYKDEVLELLPPLQDQLVMTLPISPICSDGCAGLCPECGCNLNTDKCECEKKIFNNKFTALAGLKIESSED